MTTDTTEPALESLTEQIPWIVAIKTVPPHMSEDVIVETSIRVITMDLHVHTLTNHGLTVERIAHDQNCGADFYCLTDS